LTAEFVSLVKISEVYTSQVNNSSDVNYIIISCYPVNIKSNGKSVLLLVVKNKANTTYLLHFLVYLKHTLSYRIPLYVHCNNKNNNNNNKKNNV